MLKLLADDVVLCLKSLVWCACIACWDRIAWTSACILGQNNHTTSQHAWWYLSLLPVPNLVVTKTAGMPAILPHCFENSSKPNRSTTHVINIDGNLCLLYLQDLDWALHMLSHTSMIASSHHGVIHRSCFVLQSQQCQNPWHFLRCPWGHEANKILAVDLFLSAKTEWRLHVRCYRYL